MTVCEKCWSDAYMQSLDTGKSQYECYLELLSEREDDPCEEVGADVDMEAALILLATRFYMALMERDPGQAGLWYAMITEALLPLGEQRVLEEVKRILALI